ncbi:hypothetical protein HNY73_003786 [Argiope bruennichi]|uniref:Uncharacterized protein n=1 Tax=Argiope bruennichi TaxID=94029 RepID=A0A8T0FP84_ARGBR|nr:hypothetical protein HNY73_003786 [Argiope bruennichi]
MGRDKSIACPITGIKAATDWGSATGPLSAGGGAGRPRSRPRLDAAPAGCSNLHTDGRAVASPPPRAHERRPLADAFKLERAAAGRANISGNVIGAEQCVADTAGGDSITAPARRGAPTGSWILTRRDDQARAGEPRANPAIPYAVNLSRGGARSTPPVPPEHLPRAPRTLLGGRRP